MRFLASLFFKSTIRSVDDGESNDGIWEEIILLVLADSESEALSKATEIGNQRSGLSYLSEKGEVVWEFVTVERVVPINDGELSDGQELFSRYLRGSEAESILEKFD